MTMAAITVDHLTKVYHLYDSPTARLKEALHPFRRKYHHDFYALNDVSFSVEQGESFAIIGKNGCGKSTLLKILASVLTPTSGTVIVNGNVSALLELGGGFNPEFSGLENVYFSSAIMGYSREQVEKNLDNILAFADIGEFIHQPVKTYSSGMYVRLAFAVAINVDPDILIVDEALAVGDIRFQLKCMRKMKEFREQGKTFLFVSHDTSSVKNLCKRAIWLDDGKIFQIGESKLVANNYHAFMCHGLLPTTQDTANAPVMTTIKDTQDSQQTSLDPIPPDASVSGEGGVQITGVALYTQQPYQKVTTVEGGEQVVFMYAVDVFRDIETPLLSFIVYDDKGKAIFGANNFVLEQSYPLLRKGERVLVTFSFQFPKLHNSTYVFSVGVNDGTQDQHIRLQVIFDAYMVKLYSNNLNQKQGTLLKLDNIRANLERFSQIL